MSALNKERDHNKHTPAQEHTNLESTMPFDESESICSEDTRNLTHDSSVVDMLPDGTMAKSVDRLERKKNREKRRRNEVNDRFSDLMEAVYVAEKTIMNPPPFTERSKNIPTRCESLERACRIVYALVRENATLQQILGCSATGSPRPAQAENMKFPQQPMFMAAASTAHGQFWIPVGTNGMPVMPYQQYDMQNMQNMQNMPAIGNMQSMPGMPNLAMMPTSSGAMFYPPNMLMANAEKPMESRKRTHEELTTTTTTVTSVPASTSESNGTKTHAECA